MCCLFRVTVKVLASLSKTTKAGVSTWDFVQKDDGSFAALKREPQEKAARNKADLQKLYKAFKSYGFEAVKA